MNETISTIVRFHDTDMLPALERAVQSLQGQVGVKVQPIIVTQRLGEEAFNIAVSAVKRQWFFRGLAEPQFINFQDGGSGDARTKLLNTGIRTHHELGNRYLAFLDHDDVLYTHAYSQLQSCLASSDVAFAFAMIERAKTIPLHDYDFTYQMDRPFRGASKLDLLKENFSPIHSYMVDTSKVLDSELSFNESLTRLEDYEFLLRVAARYPCDFSLMKRVIGLYCMRVDERNSTPLGSGSKLDVDKEREWDLQRRLLATLRSKFEIKFFASDFSL